MKHFGREDMAEGSMYPVGLHWGYIHQWGGKKARIERYIVLYIKTPLRKMKYQLDIDLTTPHQWAMLAFKTWPYAGFKSSFARKSRFGLTHFWAPI